MPQTVSLTYFLPLSGRFRSSAAYSSKLTSDQEILHEVHEMLNKRDLPGLGQDHRPVHVLVSGANIVPHLILCTLEEGE